MEEVGLDDFPRPLRLSREMRGTVVSAVPDRHASTCKGVECVISVLTACSHVLFPVAR